MYSNCEGTAAVAIMATGAVRRDALYTVRNAVQLQVYGVDCSSKAAILPLNYDRWNTSVV